MPARRTMLLATAALLAGCTSDPDRDPRPAPGRPTSQPPQDSLQTRFRLEQVDGPARTVVRDTAGRALAELTHGSRTVLLTGPERTLREAGTTATVTSRHRVRLGPRHYQPALAADGDYAVWLGEQLRDESPDVLAIACQYITGSRDDAGFGYINNSSTRDGADFHDYLGISWRWPDGQTSRPAEKWRGYLDCSGYLRLVFGYRLGMTLHRGNREPGDGLPRTAYAMAVRTQATVIASSRGRAPKDLSRVSPGDVAFFALHDDDPDLITHSGIVLGRDQDGALRFVSARETADGPTFGDRGARGVIDSGFFGARLRRVIRL